MCANLSEIARIYALGILEPGRIEPGDEDTFRARMTMAVTDTPLSENDRVLVIDLAISIARDFWCSDSDS